MARRLVRIPVFPSTTTSEAATFCASGAGAAKTGEKVREPTVSRPTHKPAAADALPRRRRLRFMAATSRNRSPYSIPVGRGWGVVGYPHLSRQSFAFATPRWEVPGIGGGNALMRDIAYHFCFRAVSNSIGGAISGTDVTE